MNYYLNEIILNQNLLITNYIIYVKIMVLLYSVAIEINVCYRREQELQHWAILIQAIHHMKPLLKCIMTH